MTDSEIIEIIREAIWVTIVIGAPVMLVGLFVGVAIALIQALTQIQEMTLVFVPKILAMFAALFVVLPFMTTILIDFTQRLADKMIAGGP
jgi:flagellar biosynthetic protein FliQ